MVCMSRMAGVVGVVGAFFAGSASADPVFAFGLQSEANPKVYGAPSTARGAFEGVLTNVGRVDFENLDGRPNKLDFAGSDNSATLNLGGSCLPTASIRCVVNQTNTGFGRYNTTGATVEAGNDGRWWDADGDFTLTFDKVISAFGFYATDIGDLGGELYISLTDEAGKTGNKIRVEPAKTNQDNPAQAFGAGSLAFWGFTDTTTFYKSVNFSIVQTVTDPDGYDVFGFDDLLIGNLRTAAVAEPASLALVGLSLAALAASRRRKPASI